MNIASFTDLLSAAAMQAEPQRLLFTFTRAEYEAMDPANADAPRRGTLAPVMCVDKQVGELDTFANLAAESRAMGAPWDVVLVTSLSGSAGQLPDARKTEAALKEMVQAIQEGRMERFLAFDGEGELLQFS